VSKTVIDKNELISLASSLSYYVIVESERQNYEEWCDSANEKLDEYEGQEHVYAEAKRLEVLLNKILESKTDVILK